MLAINPLRLTALGLSAAAALSSAASCSRQEAHQSIQTAAPGTSEELERCRALGVDAERDPACHQAWEKNWQHFMGGKPSKGAK